MNFILTSPRVESLCQMFYLERQRGLKIRHKKFNRVKIDTHYSMLHLHVLLIPTRHEAKRFYNMRSVQPNGRHVLQILVT